MRGVRHPACPLMPHEHQVLLATAHCLQTAMACRHRTGAESCRFCGAVPAKHSEVIAATRGSAAAVMWQTAKGVLLANHSRALQQTPAKSCSMDDGACPRRRVLWHPLPRTKLAQRVGRMRPGEAPSKIALWHISGTRLNG
eukprot:UN3108